MLAPFAIATSLLAVLSDDNDDDVDLGDVFLRSFAFNDPGIFLAKLQERKILPLLAMQSVASWLKESPSFDVLVERAPFVYLLFRRMTGINYETMNAFVSSPCMLYSKNFASEEEQAVRRKRTLPVFGGTPLYFDEGQLFEARLTEQHLLFERFKEEGLEVFDVRFLLKNFDDESYWILSWDEDRIFLEIGEPFTREIESIEYAVVNRADLVPYKLWPHTLWPQSKKRAGR